MNDVTKQIDEFCRRRGWDHYHDPASLAMAIASEAGELCHLYRWSRIDGPPDAAAVEDEVADVLIFALRLCSVLNVDPTEIVKRKVKKNAAKYPA